MIKLTIPGAIKQLERYLSEYYTPQQRVAHQMAIDALKELQRRESNVPLTLEDLISMQDQAVWVQPVGDPSKGFWGVVEGASAGERCVYLYLWGHWDYYEIGHSHEAFARRKCVST